MAYEGEIGHLPARILNAHAELLETDDDRNTTEYELPPPPPHQPSLTTCHHRTWRVQGLYKPPEGPWAQPEVVKNKDRVFKRSKRPTPVSFPEYKVYRPNAAECAKQGCPDPMDVFLLMYPPTLRETNVEMSNLYSTQTKARQLNMNMEELLTFYGILLASGYSTVPRRRMHWSLDSDVHNECISNAMRWNRFDKIMASVHFVDNTKITEDPFFKVRPIFTELNKLYKVMPYPKWLAVDESMIRYYGHHGCKQFIKGKPIRFGYKIWSLASYKGFMHHMEPYGGCFTLLTQTGLGCKFHHDNLFTSLSLLDEMTKRGYGSCGTVRDNRLFDVPFTPKKEFNKLPRGATQVLTEGEKLLVRWKDNNVVTMATNMEKSYTESVVKRWIKERHAFDQVRQPQCIKQYNEHMGGVDLHDQQASRYSITIRSKKWWWPIFAWSLNSALVNCYYFYRDVMGGTIGLLTFTRVVAQSLIQRFGTKPLSHGRRSLLATTVQDQARYDQVSHWPVNTRNRFLRCRLCDKRTTCACEKCSTSLHIECFKTYHRK
uniref:PiggyBac transposable element-derived protein domain-containing protein n=1 Tax=Sander lucioperca TaxID=283035 RepID=A0A8D0A249_SANLU